MYGVFVGFLISRNIAQNPLEMKAFGMHANFQLILKKGNQYDTSCIYIWNILYENKKKRRQKKENRDRQSDKTSIYHQDVCVFTCKYILICVLGIYTYTLFCNIKKNGTEDEHLSKNEKKKTFQSDKYVRETS